MRIRVRELKRVLREEFRYISELKLGVAGGRKMSPHEDEATMIELDGELDEVSPKGWEGTTKAMKRHADDIKNPYALAHYMKKKGAEPRYSSRRPHRKKKR